MSAPDYHPLEAGRTLTYELRRSQGVETLSVECLEASREGGALRARLRRTWGAGGSSRAEESRVERRADGLYDEGGMFLPLPPKPGTRWTRPPREYFIEGTDATAATPAGEFPGCLSVGYLIAAGDAGSGRRLYAPGVGLVHERCDDEADPYELALTHMSPRRPR